MFYFLKNSIFKQYKVFFYLCMLCFENMINLFYKNIRIFSLYTEFVFCVARYVDPRP